MPRWLRLTFKAILTASALGALVMAVDPAALLTSLATAQWEWAVIALLLVPVNLALDGWVWKRLLDTIPVAASPRAVVGAVLSGLALGFWTPARAGEYAGRALYLPQGDRWTLSLTVFAQRMVDMTVGVIVGLLALGWALGMGHVPPSGSWLAAAGIGLATGLGLAVFVAAPSLVHRLTQRLCPDWSGLADRTAFFDRLSGGPGGVVVAGSLARYVVFTGQLACLGLAFAPTAAPSLLAAAGALTFYAKYLIPSLTLLDLGIRESSAAVFFQVLGLGAAAGVNAALLLFALNVLAPALLGVPFVLRLQLPGVPAEPDDPLPASLSRS